MTSETQISTSGSEPISHVCSTPSAQLVISAIDQNLLVLDASTSLRLASTKAHEARIRLLAATNDKLVSTGDDKLLKVWSLPDLTQLSSRSACAL